MMENNQVDEVITGRALEMNGNHQNGNNENGDQLAVNGNGVASEEICIVKKSVEAESGQPVDQHEEGTPINSQGHQKECNESSEELKTKAVGAVNIEDLVQSLVSEHVIEKALNDSSHQDLIDEKVADSATVDENANPKPDDNPIENESEHEKGEVSEGKTEEEQKTEASDNANDSEAALKCNEVENANTQEDLVIAECIKSVVSDAVVNAALQVTDDSQPILEQHTAIIEEGDKEEVSNIATENLNEVTTALVSEDTLEEHV